MSKIVAVFGATGVQGGSVVRELVKDNKFQIRAITRNPNSDKAKQLALMNNVKVYQADLDDSNSLDNVLNGCYGVFLVTDLKENNEKAQGIRAIDSALKNKVTHFVFSGLDHVETVIGKRANHFDDKAEIEDYGLLHVDKLMFTSIRIPAYIDGIVNNMLKKTQPNMFVLTSPLGDSPTYLVDASEMGKYVVPVLNNPEEYKSKIIGIASDRKSHNEILELLNKHLAPNKFVNGNVTIEQFAKFPIPKVNEFVAMFEFIRGGHLKRDIELTRKLNKDALNYNDWVVANKDEILAKLDAKEIKQKQF